MLHATRYGTLGADTRVKIGPFSFLSKGGTLAVPKSHQALDQQPADWLAWLKDAVRTTSNKHRGMTFATQYLKGWGHVFVGVVMGKTPVAQIPNPYEDGKWGFYVKLGNNKITEVTYKRIPPSDWGFIGDIASGVATAAGGVVDAASAVGSGIVSAAKSVPHVVSVGANLACDVVTNSTTQQAASIAGKLPSSTAQGVALGIQVGAAICNVARGGTGSTPPPTAVKPPPPTLAQRLPAGSIQMQIPQTSTWVYAVPKGTVLPPLSGLAGAQTLAQAYEVIGSGNDKSPNATVVDPKTFKAKTTPLYKKWWFWLAVSGGILTTGTVGYVFARRAR